MSLTLVLINGEWHLGCIAGGMSDGEALAALTEAAARLEQAGKRRGRGRVA